MVLVKTETSRVGRENQRYSDKTGARMVAGCIALNAEKTKVVMITSTASKSKWVLPKGGIELDEDDYEDTAIRETWEEAGVEGTIMRELGIVEDMRPPKTFVGDAKETVFPPRSEFHFYEMKVDSLSSVWPESNERERRWCTYSEAKHELEKAKRPELVEALNRSSIIKDHVEEGY